MRVRLRTVALTAALMLVSVLALAGRQISYQGRLTDTSGAPVANSNYSVTFTLFADSTGGAVLWDETAPVTTHDGLFSHYLGSVTPLPDSLFRRYDNLYIEISVATELVSPRVRLAAVPYARMSGGLKVTDEQDSLIMMSLPDSHQFSIYGPAGVETIRLRGDTTGDAAVLLPDSSVSAAEIQDEPGIAIVTNSSLVPLLTGSMTDLVTVPITIPTAGYIVVHGKCYAVLSGTTGSNTAYVQIDENPGGGTSFPYYTIAGLSGYANTGTSYFPVYVTRVYFKQAGSYIFRMEGKASQPLPAEAKTWDHVLTAVFYPTSYEGVKVITSDPGMHPNPVPLPQDTLSGDRQGQYYEIDLRYFEELSRRKRQQKDAGSDD